MIFRPAETSVPQMAGSGIALLKSMLHRFDATAGIVSPDASTLPR